MEIYRETNTQFLARLLMATREGHQIASSDAQRLSDLAQFGPRGSMSAMPEERRDPSHLMEPIVQSEMRS